MTTAWMRMGVLQSRQPTGPGIPSPITERLKIAITESEFQVGVSAIDLQHVPRGPEGMRRLQELLTTFHRSHANESDVMLQPDSSVRYDDVVQVMDTVYAVWGSGLAGGERVADHVRVQFL
jgi:hypothetical protein